MSGPAKNDRESRERAAHVREVALALDAFDRAWRACAARGQCDHFGGVQYQRVKAEWLPHRAKAGDVEAFIRYRANLSPLGGS